MATKRLTNYEKAYNRLVKLSVEGLVSQRANNVAEAVRLSQAVERVLEAHWEDHPDECEWCHIYPPMFPK